MDKRYRMLIEALDGTPRDLRRLLRPVTPERAAQSLTNGARLIDAVAEFVAHEPAARANIERILVEDQPQLVDNVDERRTFESSDDVSIALEAFAEERARTVALLEPLMQSQWLRTATLAEHGVLRLRTLVERLIAHDNTRLARIVDMRESADRLH